MTSTDNRHLHKFGKFLIPPLFLYCGLSFHVGLSLITYPLVFFVTRCCFFYITPFFVFTAQFDIFLMIQPVSND